ncbi:TetR/AcrR family transcriptional regulator [Kitasatospora viridis]|uniref:TetR family transcriptional regulator n=1 Tax=Kitasatospora viridis TaxID=281105 RepID=A0A561ULY0_9ACTN|nr:TetR/AcrR family transcriptional regulator [Kitasatospora viridis]TWG00337.1 TetR family transcriptional regulator [Kitasatospora viridis]
MGTDRQATPSTDQLTVDPPCTAPRRGRPRSEAAELAIQHAVERLMAEGGTLGDLTIEGVAQAAGVGKATIYRRWPNKDAMLADMIDRLDEPAEPLPGTSVRDDLVAVLDYMRRRGLAKRSRWVLKMALEQMHTTPALKEAYFTRVIGRRRQQLLDLVRRGIANGELRADIDPALLAEMLSGAMLSRAVLYDDRPLDDPELAATIVDSLLEGLGGPVPSATR